MVIRRIEDGNTVSIKSKKIHNYESIKKLPLKKLKYIKKNLKVKSQDIKNFQQIYFL